MAKRKNQNNTFEIVKRPKVEEENQKLDENKSKVTKKIKNNKNKNKKIKDSKKNKANENVEKKGKYITEDSMLKLIDSINDSEETKINVKLTKQRERDEFFSKREQKLQKRKDEKKQQLEDMKSKIKSKSKLKKKSKKIIAHALESEKSENSNKKTKKVQFAI
ncbi:hypothetical protein BCR32DRAFT_290692 [Anaeromyces robustus]|uniref:Uncharacterized protein n=1 Tax=Anaeromyces robustus TaxID=1754192 RepID=A0A1Y1XI71_9FUNG|nr:hypothetical protein BCR32DRAFT_290692 [Anaeromyces robustus]|eukprot:ORX85392.1 hypothetical protein BCR32DRAFT_290692 [Anaeromyces robustus]